MTESELLNNLDYFDFVIKADSNPFKIYSEEKYKVEGEVKTKQTVETINLQKENSIIDVIINNKNIEEVNYYPKTFWKKLFGIKSKSDLSFNGDENHFIFMSKKTQSVFKTNCVVYNIDEDDKIVIGKRGRLVYYIESDQLYININQDNYKTIILK
jgi:hypothetical protein